MCEQSNANGSLTIALQQQPRPIQNGLPAFDAKTPTHSRTMRNRVQRTCTGDFKRLAD